MNRAIHVLMILGVLLSGCARKAPETAVASRPATEVDAGVAEAGPFRIAVSARPETPSVGDNTLTISVQDTLGRPVAGAHVESQVVMEAMGTMPRMESRALVKETQPGRYQAVYGLPMAGEWDLRIRIRHESGAADADYRLSTSIPGAAFAGGTPPLRGAGVGGLTADESGAVRIDPERRQAIGVVTARVQVRDLSSVIRAAGRVTYDETRRSEVSLQFPGWVREIRVDYTGKAVRAGQVLFTAYSPELFSAQQEFLTARGASGSGGDSMMMAEPDLAAAARERLLRWGVHASQIEEIARAGKPIEALPILAPTSGVVVDKSIVRGSAFTAGQTLYRIAPIDPVWVVASVYPYELPAVRLGMAATILSPFLSERTRVGRVSAINPSLDPETRTVPIRVAVPNPRGDLKPDMFVDVTLVSSLGKRLAVPESAVLYAGDQRLVFVDLGDGRFAPRTVTLGPKAGDDYEVVSGLHAGERVVTSGNFLIAAESKLRSAAQKW